MIPSLVKGSLTAILAVLSFAQHGFASPEDQDQEVMAPEDVHATTTSLRYGHCYIIKNHLGEELGHQPVPWGFLRFGAGNKRTTFRVCQSLGQCRLPHPSPYRQVLWSPGRFWLFDTEGNDYERSGSFVAANAQPFSSGGLLYPAAQTARYYVNFWGENDNCGADRRFLGNCAVKLRVDNLRSDKGLVLGTDKFPRVTTSDNNFLNVTFHERECPEHRDAMPEL